MPSTAFIRPSSVGGRGRLPGHSGLLGVPGHPSDRGIATARLPAAYVLRTVRAAQEIDGCPVPAGDRLVLSLQSANWDEHAWGPDAGQFVIDRPSGQAVNMAFGFGIRLAPGYVREAAPGFMIRRPRRLDVELPEPNRT